MRLHIESFEFPHSIGGNNQWYHSHSHRFYQLTDEAEGVIVLTDKIEVNIMVKKIIKNRIKSTFKLRNGQRFNADKWLTKNFERLVNKYPGEYIIVANGKIYRNGSPSQLRDKAIKENPGAVIMGHRVPRPKDFLCALIER